MHTYCIQQAYCIQHSAYFILGRTCVDIFPKYLEWKCKCRMHLHQLIIICMYRCMRRYNRQMHPMIFMMCKSFFQSTLLSICNGSRSGMVNKWAESSRMERRALPSSSIQQKIPPELRADIHHTVETSDCPSALRISPTSSVLTEPDPNPLMVSQWLMSF